MFGESDKFHTDDCIKEITSNHNHKCLEHLLAIQYSRLGLFDVSTILSNNATFFSQNRAQ